VILTLFVALAAGAGAVLRYLADQVVQRRTSGPFPWGTLSVNASGSLVLGLVTGLALHHGLPTGLTLTLSAGFAGGYTTLSTWAWETLALTETGAVLAATANVVGSSAIGLAAAAAGLGLGTL
jgi:fluoride exporter